MRHWLPLLMLLPAVMAQADNRLDKLAAAGVEEFTAAYQAWNGARFAAAAGLFREACTNAPTCSIYFYWQGTAEFHRLLHLGTLPASRSNQFAADAAMNAALAALNTAVELDGKSAEAHALLGTIYGMKIDGNVFRAARFGPRVQAHRNKAMQFGEDNPRVRYLLGTCQFHTARKPAAFREALASFLAAEGLFRAEAQRAPGPLEPRWGYSSCLTFIGRTCERLGQRSQAADYFRKALAAHPADHLAKEGLARVSEAK